jgi:hypothetical protein
VSEQLSRIEGKVARVLNRQELVMNVGEKDGVKRGMTFAVLNPKGVDIVDPDSKDKLGSVEIPKVMLKVARVQPRLSVARTFRTTRKNVGGSVGLGLDLFRGPEWVEETETLRLEDKPYVEELSEEESYVKIGDPVVQVLGDEFTIVE